MGLLKKSGGFTLVEVMFVAVTVGIVVTAIVSTWIFMQKTWTTEIARTNTRMDMMKAIETLRDDLRLSTLTYMSFYPENTWPHTAVSLPLATRDNDGLFSISGGKIDWDRTVVYHVWEGTLRRTIIDSFITDANERYLELVGIAESGEGPVGSSTKEDFLRDIDAFEISTIAPVIDFYEDSADALRRKALFGWVRLSPGQHTLRFEIADKHPLSGGYSIGIDSISIEPSGSARDAEYYISSEAPSGMIISSGGSTSRVHGTEWNNDNYLEFDTSALGAYIEIEDGYDLWRESAFDQVALSNTRRDGEELRIMLDLPKAFWLPEDADEPQNLKWYAHQQTGEAVQEGQNGYVNPEGDGAFEPSEALVIRTWVNHQHIDLDTAATGNEVDLVRVKFMAADSGDLRIERAYITRRDMDSAGSYDGLVNISSAGGVPSEYHFHQQLFFKDTSGGISATLEIPADSTERTAWSEWTAFPIITREGGTDIDYFVTFVVDNVDKAESKYWEGAAGSVNSYYVGIIPGEESLAGIPDWSAEGVTVEESRFIFAAAEIDTWRTTGSVESRIFDTAISLPEYNQIKWSENKPVGTSVSVKARSGASMDISDASDWSAIGDSSIGGTGRYLQFRAELACTPYWQSGGGVLSYSDYISQHLAGGLHYEFPASGGTYYTTGLAAPWVDDIEIDWPGVERICAITGQIARKNDYGQAKLTVDGQDLFKILSVRVKTVKHFHGRDIENEHYVEIEPRNTGK
ncbi:MAG: type II secretion system protein [Candidatus Omnitrophota bacterium]